MLWQTTLEQLKSRIADEIAPFIGPIKNWTPAYTDSTLGRKLTDWERSLRELTPRIAAKMSALALLAKNGNHAHITHVGFGIAMSARLSKIHASLRNEVALMKEFTKEMDRGKREYQRDARNSGTGRDDGDEFDPWGPTQQQKRPRMEEARPPYQKPLKDDRNKSPNVRTPYGANDERLWVFLKAAMTPEATRRRGCYACVYLGVDYHDARHDVDKCWRWEEAKALAIKSGFKSAPHGSR